MPPQLVRMPSFDDENVAIASPAPQKTLNEVAPDLEAHSVVVHLDSNNINPVHVQIIDPRGILLIINKNNPCFSICLCFAQLMHICS